MSSRRRFLGHAAGAAALAGLGAVGELVARARAIEPARRHGDLRDVQHVVILTQENRGFDHYFGALAGVRGFADPWPVPLPNGRTVWQQPAAGEPARRIAPFHLDTRARFELMRAEGTPHRWPDAQQAWDHGRLAQWPAHKENHSLAHFEPADLPFYTALADAFTLCDAYHCSFQGGTWPNRLYLWTGTIDPQGTGGGPALYNEFEDFGSPDSAAGYRWTTYAERLEAAGIAWQVYQDIADNFGDNPLAGFKTFRDAFHRRPGHRPRLRERAATTRALDALRADVLASRLPQVSWVVAPVADSEHPWKSSPAQGADYTARVLDALLADPAVWARTVLLVNYDENDGWFDHLPPPAPPSVTEWHDDARRRRYAGCSRVSTEGEYHERLAPEHHEASELQWLQRPYGLGPRVPMFVVSPWSRGGWVCSEVFDHTSVLRLLERRFGVAAPGISRWRRVVCGDLGSAFDFAAPRAELAGLRLPDTRESAARARALPGRTLPVPPAAIEPPVQAAGTRASRALPYELHARCRGETGGVRIEFENRGRAGAVIHVYDRLRLAGLPRRYTLGPGQRCSDVWEADANGRHDLWLLGPNGWHRQFAGEARRDAAQVQLELPARGGPALRLINPRREPLRFVLTAATYVERKGADGAQELVVAPGAARRVPLALATHRWYDWIVTLAEEPGYLRRYAGRVEDGRPSISDPAMHGPAVMAPTLERPEALVRA